MPNKVPRRPLRPWRGWVRGALTGLSLWLAVPIGQGHAQNITHWSPPAVIIEARFAEPNAAYAHGVLGDAMEWSALHLTHAGRDGRSATVKIRLPSDHVFEDLAPRLVDLSLDGHPDAVMVVETDIALGAALALYGAGGKIAETPHIGIPFRWLAPVGAADLDGDGHIEIAYIDRPHLAKTLRIWRFKGGDLTEIATIPGLTNHRIGEDFISGGLRDCGTGPELIMASGDWSRVMAVSHTKTWIKTDIGPFHGPDSLTSALAC
ncbi:VCBS repeat-containing protein [Ruegeria sp. 2012CJ41-6]|uniref:VCBS repeat-containing protein n=1 Tax=Ruegeria spongiae TaxID=2942209 RepID=A0ABT0Q3M5_9RHOB|nr:VCBS repeat-containing protein [Ruegeria spongiae]MCL6284392.1 VCBS repeat-containing protein [Ruegeria spongiae]